MVVVALNSIVCRFSEKKNFFVPNIVFLYKKIKLTGQQLDDLLHLLLEADVQDPVGLVHDEALQVLGHEVGGVLEVV